MSDNRRAELEQHARMLLAVAMIATKTGDGPAVAAALRERRATLRLVISVQAQAENYLLRSSELV